MNILQGKFVNSYLRHPCWCAGTRGAALHSLQNSEVRWWDVNRHSLVWWRVPKHSMLLPIKRQTVFGTCSHRLVGLHHNLTCNRIIYACVLLLDLIDNLSQIDEGRFIHERIQPISWSWSGVSKNSRLEIFAPPIVVRSIKTIRSYIILVHTFLIRGIRTTFKRSVGVLYVSLHILCTF